MKAMSGSQLGCSYLLLIWQGYFFYMGYSDSQEYFFLIRIFFGVAYAVSSTIFLMFVGFIFSQLFPE